MYSSPTLGGEGRPEPLHVDAPVRDLLPVHEDNRNPLPIGVGEGWIVENRAFLPLHPQRPADLGQDRCRLLTQVTARLADEGHASIGHGVSLSGVRLQRRGPVTLTR